MRDTPLTLPIASARRKTLVCALALAGCALAGCAVGPDYQRPDLKPPTHWSRLKEGETPLAHAGKVGDLSRWWRRLNDPLLSALVQEAQQANLDLHQARARLREARARRSVAAAAYYPTASASVSASRSGNTRTDSFSRTGNQLSASFDAGWELDIFGGVRRGVEAAEADQQASEASLNDTRVSLCAEVARTYVEVRSLQRRITIAQDNLARQAETLQLTEYRAQAGLVSSQDVEQAKSNHEQTLAQIPSLKISLAAAEHRLDLLLGQPPDTLQARLAGGGDLPTAPDSIAVGIPADTLRQRPDVRVAERKLAAETARLGVAKAALYPSLNLSGSIGVDALSQSTWSNGFSMIYSLLAGLTAPLFYGGRLRAQVEEQDAVREQALSSYKKTVLTALQEVEDALVTLSRTRERREALTRAVEAARTAAELAQQRYRAGVIDFQSVLDTERNVLTLEDSLASTRADGVLALIQLYKALGGGWAPQTASRKVKKGAS